MNGSVYDYFFAGLLVVIAFVLALAAANMVVSTIARFLTTLPF
jgi:hypothetical protein